MNNYQDNVDIPLTGISAVSMASDRKHQRLCKLTKPAFHGEQIKR